MISLKDTQFNIKFQDIPSNGAIMAGLYQITVRVLRYDTIKTNIINKTSSTLTQKTTYIRLEIVTSRIIFLRQNDKQGNIKLKKYRD